MVNSKVKAMQRRRQVRVDEKMMDDLFRRRFGDDSVNIPKALEANFHDPQTPAEQRIKEYIDQYRERQTKELESELFF